MKMRGDKGCENRMIGKHMMLLRNNSCGGYIGGKSTRNTRIERFWREHNTNVTKSFQNEFIELEELDLLEASKNSDLWALHYVCMEVIQREISNFKEICNNHPLRTENNKTPLQLHISSCLSHEVRRKELHPDSMDALNNWLANNNDVLFNNQVNVDPINSYDFSNETLTHMQNIKNSNTTNQLKHIAAREMITSFVE
jgi:hypothetical protein